MARRPKGVKVSNLTPMNVSALKAARGAGWVPSTVQITATTATWPTTHTASNALDTVLRAIREAKAVGADSRSLHAVRRKLEKLADGSGPVPVTPDPPKARKARKPADCDHPERYRLSPVRVKCLECGLTFDAPQDPPEKPQRPARPGQGGVTTAQVVPAAPAAPAPQNGTRPAYASILHGDSYLVVSLGDGIQPGEVVATCQNPVHAHQLVVALNGSR